MAEYEDNDKGKLFKKMKENPFMPVGIAGLLVACAYGAHKFKHKGGMSTSVFLMQLRVAAQGTVVGTLMLGLAYSMLKEHVFNKKL